MNFFYIYRVNIVKQLLKQLIIQNIFFLLLYLFFHFTIICSEKVKHCSIFSLHGPVVWNTSGAALRWVAESQLGLGCTPPSKWCFFPHQPLQRQLLQICLCGKPALLSMNYTLQFIMKTSRKKQGRFYSLLKTVFSFELKTYMQLLFVALCPIPALL